MQKNRNCIRAPFAFSQRNSTASKQFNAKEKDEQPDLSSSIKLLALSVGIAAAMYPSKSHAFKIDPPLTHDSTVQSTYRDYFGRTEKWFLPDSTIFLKGTIRNELGGGLSDVSISVKGSKQRALTDLDGHFSLLVKTGQTLVLSHVNYEAYELKIKNGDSLNLVLKPKSGKMDDVVITGIFQRPKESFSGSSATYTLKELKEIGNQNLLQSLKTLDPSFALIDNNLTGSNPNKLPNIEIRGKTSVIGLKDQFGSDPNQPLFILDGFESTLSVISDMSMDRVASITVLKDAAATAIYGSKAANGVVVVETKRPVPGKLKIEYNLNSSLNIPDLSDYNLMNAAEKLQFEKLSTFYGILDDKGNILSADGEANYNERKKEVERGVNTYWPNEPLRTVLTQRHTLSAEGGDNSFRYMATLNYGKTPGVMKSSSRDVINGNIRLQYRVKAISFSNSLSIDVLNTNQEPVPFSNFARANPYYRKYNDQGGFDKLLLSYQYRDPATFAVMTTNVYSPLYDMHNNNVNKSDGQAFTNNFEIEWRLDESLKARGRFGLWRNVSKTQVFRSPFNSEFVGADPLRQGTYGESHQKDFSYDGEFTLTYGKLFQGVHMVNAVAGTRMLENSTSYSAYQVLGFVDDEFANPAFAFGFKEGSNVAFNESKKRSASFYLNTGYAYNNRYLLDATVRSDGSSVYGADRQFTTIWSVGLGWNLHNEAFFRNNVKWVDYLKLRGSIGNPGNQNFSDYISMRVYRYNNDNKNMFGSSVVVSNFGNKGLQWQQTLDRNIGLDLAILDRRLNITVDYFNKSTDPLLVFVTLPTSSGTSTLAQNIGKQTTKGVTLVANYMLIRKQDFNWSANFNLRHLKSQYLNIGNSLAQYNSDNRSRNLVRYYDGGSPSDLWAVRSVGIDPTTGREIFLNSNNQQTFAYNFNDERVVGNSDPKVEGIIGTSFRYKGFSASANFRYRLGGQIFLQTLYDKVENISITNVAYNQDKRALYDRWQKPGDIAKFRSISLTDPTPISSRFVADNNIFSGESISVGYESITGHWLRSIHASSIYVRAYMNDIFRISSVKNERGIDYPFARSVSFSVGVRF